ncbi:MAG: Isopentenyl-diphosphate Delta-isomerase [Microgenomates group bacterium GW2011_GWC2_46_7]|nr:MAG: Isopentenyl-diphosphate Delta-isomerase [Microgenomates group bacterium GW2011_GWC2_46_7]
MLGKTVEEIDQKYHDRKVVVVDENDTEVRIAGLVEAHRDPGLQHRAFSLQLYREVGGKKELLLQQRAVGKPVFPFYWANTCCYNMAPGEEYLTRAISRVKEEMGAVVDVSILHILYSFTYYAPDVEGWCENELDMVIVGEWNPPSPEASDGHSGIKLNPEEAMDSRWVEWEELNKDIESELNKYAPWFRTIVKDSRFRSVFE